MKGSLFSAILPGLILLGSPAALAYIPPSNFIVKNIAAKHVSLKNGVRIKAEVSSSDPTKGDVHFKSVLVFDPATRTLRAWATDAADRKLFSMERKADTFTPTDTLAFESRAFTLEKILISKGVPIKTEAALLELLNETERREAETLSLKRFNNLPCWVIGKAGSNQSELWVEKDSFLPLRFILGSTLDPVVAEFQMDGYRFQYGFPFARATSLFSRSGAPLLREETKDLYVGSVAVDFKVSSFTPGYTEEGNAASAPLRELIDQYFKLLR